MFHGPTHWSERSDANVSTNRCSGRRRI